MSEDLQALWESATSEDTQVNTQEDLSKLWESATPAGEQQIDQDEDLNQLWEGSTPEEEMGVPPIVAFAQEVQQKNTDSNWLAEATKATAKQVGSEFMQGVNEYLVPIAKGDFSLPKSVVDTVAGLGVGVLKFVGYSAGVARELFNQAAANGLGGISVEDAKAIAELETAVLDFEPTDKLAIAALNTLGSTIVGAGAAYEALADVVESAGAKKLLTTVGEFFRDHGQMPDEISPEDIRAAFDHARDLGGWGVELAGAKVVFGGIEKAIKIKATGAAKPKPKIISWKESIKARDQQIVENIIQMRETKGVPGLTKAESAIAKAVKAEWDLKGKKITESLKKVQLVKEIRESIEAAKGKVRVHQFGKDFPAGKFPASPEGTKAIFKEKKSPKLTPPKALKPKAPREMPPEASVEIPELKSSNEAFDFGEKATPEQIVKLHKAYEAGASKALKLDKQAKTLKKEGKIKEALAVLEEAGLSAQKNQFFREAYETAEGDIVRDPADGRLKYKSAVKEGSKAIPPEPIAGKGKEPWEMTRDEYAKSYRDESSSKIIKRTKQWKALQQLLSKNKPSGKRDGLITPQQWRTFSDKHGNPDTVTGDLFHFFNDPAGTGGKIVKRAATTETRQHYMAVEQALAENKPVPKNVLKDYPDLKPPKPEGKEAKPQSQDITVDSLGLQSLYEKGTRLVSALKESTAKKTASKIAQFRDEFLEKVKGNPLDKSAVEYLRSGRLKDYIDNMPALGDLKPGELFKYDPEAAGIIASLKTKDGRLKPAVRTSGYHAIAEFSDAIAGYKDISKLSYMTSDFARLVESMDQGIAGGPVAKHVMWPTRMNDQAKFLWTDTHKADLSKILDSNKIRSNKQGKILGEVIEKIDSDIASMPIEEVLKNKGIVRTLDSLKVKPSKRADYIGAAQQLRQFADKLLDDQNFARGKRNQKLIDKRQFYRPWVIKTNLWTRLMGQRSKPSEIMESPVLPDFIEPNKPMVPHTEIRTGLLEKYPKETNIIKLMADYVDGAAKDIFDTNVIHNAKIHAAVMRQKGMPIAANNIETWAAEVYAGVDPRLTRWAKETIHPSLRSGLLKIRRNLTRAVFPLNWTWNLFIQTSSAGLTFMRYGPTASIYGLKYFTSRSMRDAVKNNAYSKIIKGRWGGRSAYQDVSTSIVKNKRLQGSKIEKAEDFLNFFTNAIEDSLTGHAVTAAYRHGSKKLGLKGRALWEYASDGGAKTQSMYDYGSVPGLLRAKEVGAVFPFQTFAFEIFNTVRELNLVGVRKVIGKTGTYETISASSALGKATVSRRLAMIAKWTAAIMVTNAVAESAIGRKPWEPSSFVPFLGYIINGQIARGPAPITYKNDFVRGVEDVLKHEDFRKLRKWIIKYHAPAGLQINRVIEGIEAVARGGIYSVDGKKLFDIEEGEGLKAVTMGPWATKGGSKYFQKGTTLRDKKKYIK